MNGRSDNTPSKVSAEFEAVFARLHGILQKHVGRLSVAEDSPRRYSLECGLHPVNKKPMSAAWGEIGKGYVSFHHMGVYACAALREGFSRQLQARMQGKSCFNFKVRDETLFSELEKMTAGGFDALREAGYLP